MNIFRLLKLSNNLARKIIFLYRVGNAASFNPGNVVTRISSAFIVSVRSILERKVHCKSLIYRLANTCCEKELQGEVMVIRERIAARYLNSL